MEDLIGRYAVCKRGIIGRIERYRPDEAEGGVWYGTRIDNGKGWQSRSPRVIESQMEQFLVGDGISAAEREQLVQKGAEQAIRKIADRGSGAPSLIYRKFNGKYEIQLRYHDLGGVEYVTVATLSEDRMHEVTRAGIPHWLYAEQEEELKRAVANQTAG